MNIDDGMLAILLSGQVAFLKLSIAVLKLSARDEFKLYATDAQ